MPRSRMITRERYGVSARRPEGLTTPVRTSTSRQPLLTRPTVGDAGTEDARHLNWNRPSRTTMVRGLVATTSMSRSPSELRNGSVSPSDSASSYRDPYTERNVGAPRHHGLGDERVTRATVTLAAGSVSCQDQASGGSPPPRSSSRGVSRRVGWDLGGACSLVAPRGVSAGHRWGRHWCRSSEAGIVLVAQVSLRAMRAANAWCASRS